MVNERGYETVRDWIMSPDGWSHFAVYDQNDEEVTRIEIDTDSRASWITSETDQTIEVEVELSGADSDIDYTEYENDELEMDQSSLYEDDTATEPTATTTWSSVIFASDSDSVIVSHAVEVPEDV